MPELLAAVRIAGALALCLYGLRLAAEGLQRLTAERLLPRAGGAGRAALAGAAASAIGLSSSGPASLAAGYAEAGLIEARPCAAAQLGAAAGDALLAGLLVLLLPALSGGGGSPAAAIAAAAFAAGYAASLAGNRGPRANAAGRWLMGLALVLLGLGFLAPGLRAAGGLPLLAALNGGSLQACVSCLALGAGLALGEGSAAIVIILALGAASAGLLDARAALCLLLGTQLASAGGGLIAARGAGEALSRAARTRALCGLLGAGAGLGLAVGYGNWGLGSPASAALGLAAAQAAALLACFAFPGLWKRLPPGKAKRRAARSGVRTPTWKPAALGPTAALNLMQARRDLADLAEASAEPLRDFGLLLPGAADSERGNGWMEEAMEAEKRARAVENYGDRAREGIARFLLETARQDLDAAAQAELDHCLRAANELEGVSDDCLALARILSKLGKKKTALAPEEAERLSPLAAELEGALRKFADFCRDARSRGDDENGPDLEPARAELDRLSRRRLEAGAEVKAELQFQELLRLLGKIGNGCRAASALMAKPRGGGAT